MATDQPPEPSDTVDEPSPLPPVTPALRARLQKCYEHGTKLMQQDKYDYDYAHTMFTECVARDPGNLIYVESFFENLQRKFKQKKGSRLKGFGGKGTLKKLSSKGDWLGVIRLGLDQLKNNPWDVPVLRAMAEACEALHLNEVELRILKNALDVNPKDVEVNRHCAKSLARMGQFDMAIACWHRVEENRRGDREAAKMISELTIERSRAQAGFGEPVEFPSNPLANREETEQNATSGASETESRQEIELTPRQKLEKAILDDPTVVENYLELANLLVEDGRIGDAEQVVNRGLSASGGDIVVREALEDIQMKRARAQLAVAERRAVEDQADESQQLAADMKAEVLQREVEILDARCQRYPEDIRLKFELGARLKRMGKYEQAVSALELALTDERLQAAAQVELGECHQHLKDYQAAMQAYRASIQAAGQTQADVAALALYRAGVLAMGLKDLNNAEKYLKQLDQIDSNYKDVKSRLDKIAAIRENG